MIARTHTSTSGALPWRIGSDGSVEVGLVHRGKRGDWSIPKGGADAGESARDCAQRELLEETGFEGVLGDELPAIRYLDRKRREKTVRYWAAEAVAGRFVPNTEVDDLRWVSPVASLQMLSHARERAIVIALANRLAAQADGAPGIRERATLVIRGAAAVSADDWKGSDASRPLTDAGRTVAHALRMVASTFEITEVLSATTLRSLDTVTPLATRELLEVDATPMLNEGRPEHNLAVVDAVRGLGAAVCMHESSIRELLLDLQKRDGTHLDPRFRVRRGSVWALFGDADAYRSAVYVPMPDADLIAASALEFESAGV